ncbi:MAG: hypothetical protein V1766_14460 [Pseudomonadota bacterium]
MSHRLSLFGMSLPQSISLISFILALASIWLHMEIRIAEINVDLANLKQDMVQHKTDNRKDFDILRSDINGDTQEIIRKIDEIQIYLRNNK